MMENLKKLVFEANMQLPHYGLVTFTWGNVSGIDREKNLVVIKPSGIPYEMLSPSQMVVVDLEGNKIEGELNPSSDTPTHLELYKHFSNIGGVVHTHSRHAVSFAQACSPIPALGTTHADYFYGSIPCTRTLTQQEVEKDYEKNTGLVICETFEGKNADAIPGVLAANHGPFAWGANPAMAVRNAVVMEESACMAIQTRLISIGQPQISQYILDKHYFRKHGENAYYGQNKTLRT